MASRRIFRLMVGQTIRSVRITTLPPSASASTTRSDKKRKSAKAGRKPAMPPHSTMRSDERRCYTQRKPRFRGFLPFHPHPTPTRPPLPSRERRKNGWRAGEKEGRKRRRRAEKGRGEKNVRRTPPHKESSRPGAFVCSHPTPTRPPLPSREREFWSSPHQIVMPN